MSEWLKEADCNSAGYAYAGSNPARPKYGEVTEWLKVPTWNVGLVVTLTRVRIPLSPCTCTRAVLELRV